MRYWVHGKQREKSFKDKRHPTTGRVEYGSGKKLAAEFQLKLTVDKRSGDRTFADYTRLGKQSFGEACEEYISRLNVGDRSKELYRSAYRNHVRSVFGDRTLAQVARDRAGVQDLLTVKMGHLSDTLRSHARMVIVGTCDEAVKAEKLARHLLADIEIATKGTNKSDDDFVFPDHAQVAIVADGGTNPDTGRAVKGAGICVWLMRGCGLRIEEALAVEKADFRDDGKKLRVSGQASRDGKKKVPLKHRKQSDCRNVPVPAWLWEIVKDMPAGPLMPGRGDRRFEAYNTVWNRFRLARELAGIPDGFTPHSLRHAFASVLLGKGVPLGDVAEWLGHRDVNQTYKTYRHMMPEAPDRALEALDSEFKEWSTQTT